MNGKVRKSIAALGVTSLMVVGIASAQEATETPDSTTPETTEQVDGRPVRSRLFPDLILEYTGLDAEALHTALVDGSTLAELIEANGMSVDDFIAAAIAAHDAQVAEARASFEERLTEALNGEGGLWFGFGFEGGRGGFGGGRGDGFGGGRPDGMGRGDRGPRGGFPGYGVPAPDVTEEAPAEGTTT